MCGDSGVAEALKVYMIYLHDFCSFGNLEESECYRQQKRRNPKEKESNMSTRCSETQNRIKWWKSVVLHLQWFEG